MPTVAQDYMSTAQPTVTTGSESLSPPTDRLPCEMSTPRSPAVNGKAGVSLAENALRDIDKTVMKTTNTTQSAVTTGSEILSPLTVNLPNKMSVPMPLGANAWVGMSPSKNALHDAGESMATIDVSKAWDIVLSQKMPTPLGGIKGHLFKLL